jgi:hypothetical protein
MDMDLQDLCFDQGLEVASLIGRKFGQSISPSFPGWRFLLVVSFGRCKFRLYPSTINLILQATIGGVAFDFEVLQLGDRTFHFFVTSREVGLFIYRLISFEC